MLNFSRRVEVKRCPLRPLERRSAGMPLAFAFQTTSAVEVLGSMAIAFRGVFKEFDSIVSTLFSEENAKYLVAGALAGIVSRTFVSPLEVVATVNMCSAGSCAPPMQQLRQLFMAEGIKGFFRGNLANCMKVAPTKGIQFVTFELFKRLISNVRHAQGRDPKTALHPVERLAAGGVAGVAAALVCYPLEVAKTLLTTHPEMYKGVFGTLYTVARQQGVRSLYRGLFPTLLAMFPYVGLEFMIYEHLKLRYEEWTNNQRPHVMVLLSIGAVAGASALTVCHPLDVVRKRMQLQGVGGRPIQYRGFFDAMRNIAKQEGAPALYRGLSPTYMSVFPSAGVSYVIYEGAKSALGVRSFS
mmetsp:Transcript_34865/g.137758  ORF Transcript_34865/g.137758 Transcript_34865/m.137758 type:complete len:355 (-) Transcript_34865:4931-5995(-)